MKLSQRNKALLKTFAPGFILGILLIYNRFTPDDIPRPNKNSAPLSQWKLSQTDYKNCVGTKTRIIGRQELERKLELHRLWVLSGHESGERADLSGLCLAGANLGGILLDNADLRGACLVNAHLGSASLRGADLGNSYLNFADLGDADLSGADLRGASLDYNYLAGTIFAVAADKQPDAKGLWLQPSLHLIRAGKDLAPLEKLRDKLKAAGMEKNAGDLNYAILRERARKMMAADDPWQRLFGFLGLLLFEWPSDWGREPFRAIVSIALLAPLFAVYYYLTLVRAGRDGRKSEWMWRIESDEQSEGFKQAPFRDGDLKDPVDTAHRFSGRSLICIGWKEMFERDKDLNLASKGEHYLKPIGRVRLVSVIQSVVSLYLLALAAACCLGRPFG